MLYYSLSIIYLIPLCHHCAVLFMIKIQMASIKYYCEYISIELCGTTYIFNVTDSAFLQI